MRISNEVKAGIKQGLEDAAFVLFLSGVSAGVGAALTSVTIYFVQGNAFEKVAKEHGCGTDDWKSNRWVVNCPPGTDEKAVETLAEAAAEAVISSDWVGRVAGIAASATSFFGAGFYVGKRAASRSNASSESNTPLLSPASTV